VRVALGERHMYRGQHAIARRRVDSVGNHADDFVTRTVIRMHAQRLADRLLTVQIPAHERLVDNGHVRAADTIAVAEVTPAPQTTPVVSKGPAEAPSSQR
jgi:hypothetical protein